MCAETLHLWSQNHLLSREGFESRRGREVCDDMSEAITLDLAVNEALVNKLSEVELQ